jgi:predicted DNA-binding transcriptional regulator AlpA
MSRTLVPAALVYTALGLAEVLDTSIRSIHRLNSSGKIPRPTRLGGQLRWNRDEIAAWIAAGMPDRQAWERRRVALRPE